MSSCTGRNPTAAQLLCPASCKPTPLREGAGLEELIPLAPTPLASVGLIQLQSLSRARGAALPSILWDTSNSATCIFPSYSFSLIHLRSQTFQGEVFLLLCVQCSGISSSLQHYSNLVHLLGKVEGLTSSTLRNSSWDHPESS